VGIMPGILDFLEPLFRGDMKYFSGLVFGTVVILILRFIYIKWMERQKVDDMAFVEKHKGESIEVFKKKFRIILISIVVLLFVVQPLVLFATVKFLMNVLDVEPWLGVSVILIEIFILFVLMIIQTVRFARLNRRIKLMEKSDMDRGSL
jgi:sterol desaturase/sphingolipid hydroxylase (fatty acid hydroxylase superfamily)